MKYLERLIECAIPYAVAGGTKTRHKKPTVDSVLSPCRCAPCVSVRRMVAKVLYDANYKVESIGRALGRDHSSICHLVRPSRRLVYAA